MVFMLSFHFLWNVLFDVSLKPHKYHFLERLILTAKGEILKCKVATRTLLNTFCVVDSKAEAVELRVQKYFKLRRVLMFTETRQTRWRQSGKS